MTAEERRFDDDWGSIDRLLREFGPMVPILTDGQNRHESLRAFTRWFFASLEALAHALKKIAARQAEAKKVEMSRREQQVLQIIQEPSFPGLPPPRRVEASFREGLATAILVFARVRGTDPPLTGGALPAAFIDAMVVFDRFSRPQSGEDLDPSSADYQAIGKAVIWFRDLQQWLYRERLAEIEEMKKSVQESFEETKRKIEDLRKD